MRKHEHSVRRRLIVIDGLREEFARLLSHRVRNPLSIVNSLLTPADEGNALDFSDPGFHPFRISMNMHTFSAGILI
jgi:hypothetical protein